MIATHRIKDKNGDTPLDLAGDDKEITAMIRKARAQASVSMDDVADGASVFSSMFQLI